jgi:hypothetical protein
MQVEPRRGVGKNSSHACGVTAKQSEASEGQSPYEEERSDDGSTPVSRS